MNATVKPLPHWKQDVKYVFYEHLSDLSEVMPEKLMDYDI